MKIVTGIFHPNEAADALHRLSKAGFNRDDFSMMSSVSQVPAYLEEEGEPEEAAVDGATVGAVTGGSLGVLGTWAASTIPGFDTSIFVTGLMTTAVGTVIGGYLGSLYNVRAEDQTKIDIHEELAAGKTLVIVKVNGSKAELEKAAALLEKSHGQRIETHIIPNEEVIVEN